MRSVIKPLVAVALFAAAGLLFLQFVLPALQEKQDDSLPPPEASGAGGLPDEVSQRLAQAPLLDVPELLKEALETYAGRPEEAEVRKLLARRSMEASNALQLRVDELLNDYRYVDVVDVAKRYARVWGGTDVSRLAKRLLEEARSEQAEQVEQRKREANELLDAGRFDGAREALQTTWLLEPAYRDELGAHAVVLERLIRVRSYRPPPRPTTGTAPPVAAAPGHLAPPPALPVYPHEDVRRMAEARDLMLKTRDLFGARKYVPAVEAAGELLASYGDLPYVRRERDAIDAMTLLARHGTSGLRGLFHAAESVGKGRRVRLKYLFRAEDEALDWEELPTIPHKDSGNFEAARAGVRGNGVSTYLLRAFFENDVKIRCESLPQRRRTYGLAFCQQDNETRQIMLLVTNHWFVEGENYVLERPGHSLIMIGKGTNADVPVDAPENGFIFRGATREEPVPAAGDTLDISFALDGDKMHGEVALKTQRTSLRHTAVGDDGRGIERVRPALFVIQNSVLFSEIVIEGRLHADFERQRVDELLQMLE